MSACSQNKLCPNAATYGFLGAAANPSAEPFDKLRVVSMSNQEVEQLRTRQGIRSRATVRRKILDITAEALQTTGGLFSML